MRLLGHNWVLMKVSFLEWRTQALATKTASLEAQVEALHQGAERDHVSIWRMRRHELDEVARRELSMTAGQLRNETVTTLRERIRAARAAAWDMEDPLASAPPGLMRMRVDEVAHQCQLRGLETFIGDRRMTKAQMIIALKEFVTAQAAAIRIPPVFPEEPREIPMSNGATNRGTASSAAAATDPRVPMQGITEQRKREAGHQADDRERATRC